MGTRINKMIGYGLVNVAVDEAGRIVDPRINADSPLLDSAQHPILDDYLAFLDAHGDGDILAAETFEAASLRRMVERVPRHRLAPQAAVVHRANDISHVLCIRPLWMDQWHRHDDTIDWIEESYFVAAEQRMVDRVDALPHGLYPYNGVYMDIRTGDRLGDEVMYWIRARSAAADRDDTPPLGEREMSALAAIIRRRGDRDGDPVFTSHAEAERFIAPIVPDEIASLARFGGLFTDEAVLRQLRPMRLVWWA